MFLPRLPAKALMISRYVRKDWRRLYFSEPYSNIQFVRKNLTAGSKFLFGYFVDEVSTGNLRMETLDFSYKLPHDFLKEGSVVNSCNGLVCLVNDNKSVVCVCNPILRECVSIPIPNRNNLYASNCALGFSAKNNQYKILSCIEIGEDHTNLKYKWEIYTLGTGHWRSIETNETITPWRSEGYSISSPHFNTFIHGSLHWTNPRYDFVQSFNFETERFTEFSLPDESTLVLDLGVELGVINDCLWASFHNYGRQYEDCEMWAMKEYGDEKSWTMTLALRDHFDPPDEELLARHKELVIYDHHHICDHNLLFTLNGEEMLVSSPFDCRLFCYNIKRMRYRVLEKCIDNVIAYNPSFVSLYDVGRGEQVTRGEFPGKCDKFGRYKCADCGSPLYKSRTRFNSGCGLPSLFEGLSGDGLSFQKDPDGWRTEISCRACGAPCVQRGWYT